MVDLALLFFISFASATIFPGVSEAYVYHLLSENQGLALVIVVATLGNTMGAFINYTIGRWSRKLLFVPFLGFKKKTIRKARARFKKWGGITLFLSFLPIIGDPITAVAGLMLYPLKKFFFWVSLGKMIRYSLVSLIYVYAR